MPLNADIQTYLSHAGASTFYQQEVEIVEAWEGSQNLLWRVRSNGREAVLKLYLDAGQARSRRQYDGQLLFAPMGFAPRPLWFDRYPEGLSRQVLVYEWMPGESINVLKEEQLRALAETIARVHAADPNEVRRFSPQPVNLDFFWRVQQGSLRPIQTWLQKRGSAQLTVLFQDLQDRAQRLVDEGLPLWEGAPPAPVHGDLKAENALFSFGTAVLLDWEMFGIGDPSLDVAAFLHLTQQELDDNAVEGWLDSYLTLCDQPQLARRIGVYRRLLPFQSLCYILDGLRNAKGEMATDGETLNFLRSLLVATLDASARALKLQVASDFQRLVAQLELTSES